MISVEIEQTLSCSKSIPWHCLWTALAEALPLWNTMIVLLQTWKTPCFERIAPFRSRKLLLLHLGYAKEPQKTAWVHDPERSHGEHWREIQASLSSHHCVWNMFPIALVTKQSKKLVYSGKLKMPYQTTLQGATQYWILSHNRKNNIHMTVGNNALNFHMS